MPHSMICCVVNMGDASRVLKIARNYHIKGGSVSIGTGTVCNRLLEFLAINETRKEVVTLVMEREAAAEAIREINDKMSLAKPNHGIAFLRSLLECADSANRDCDTTRDVGCADSASRSGNRGADSASRDCDTTRNVVKENHETTRNVVKEKVMYNIIYVIVEKGKAEDVIDAANKAGSTGATIINARGAGSGEVRTFFSMEIESEKEEIFFVVRSDQKDTIVEAIREHLETDESGNDILFVLNVDEVYGLRE